MGEEGFFDANGPNADLNPWGLPNNVQVLGSRWCVLYHSGKNTGHFQVLGIQLPSPQQRVGLVQAPEQPLRKPCKHVWLVLYLVQVHLTQHHGMSLPQANTC